MVFGVRRSRPASAMTASTAAVPMVARIALPAELVWGSSRTPRGVWKRIAPGESTRSTNTG